MNKNSSDTSWVIFGVGNFIFDIFDAIESNNEKVSEVVLNTKTDIKLLKRLYCRITKLEDFKPKKNQKYIFGFLDPNKSKFIASLKQFGIQYSSLIHSNACIASGCALGEGNYIGAGVVFGPQSTIGNFNYLNRGVLIGHDVEIGDYNHFGPGSVICGRCSIKDSNNFGAGSVVNDGLRVNSGCVIGSNSTVVRDILIKGTYIGTPARLLE